MRRGGKAMSVHRMNEQPARFDHEEDRRAGPAVSLAHRLGITGDNSVRLGLGNAAAEHSEDGNADDAESSYLG